MNREEEARRIRIARTAARYLRPNDVVNLGYGIPSLLPDHLPAGLKVFFHTENGMIGFGPLNNIDEADPTLTDAGGRPIAELPGASYFDSAFSFALLRSGHVNVTVLGALQVSQEGDIANWSVPGQDVLGVGGAMDVISGGQRTIVCMMHTTHNGAPKVVRFCTLPLTARCVASRIVTELAVFSVTSDGLLLEERAPEVRVEEIERLTEAEFRVAPTVRVMEA